ncbi:hypothetical protein DRQ21_04680 [Candidatus Fermentibacteria bacterium]|nr:MAG: hypothetical protein DRQ21_04680 [Candidatus Fermentibacteria bacterium]
MQIIIFTAGMMWKRAVKMKSRLWLAGLAAVSILIITPPEKTATEFVSLFVLLPVVFLQTGWSDSRERKGIMTLINRGGTTGMVRFAEWSFPALGAVTVSSVLAFAAAPPPWQFWVVLPLTAVSISLVYLTTEQHLKFAGRTVFIILWLLQLSQPAHTKKLLDLVLFTDYPAAVLLASPDAGTHHPDSFVLASLILVFLAAGTRALVRRRNS